MDVLKGKKIMVWTFMGNARMYTALRNYGDRISQIGYAHLYQYVPAHQVALDRCE